jgi:outer membrane receptor protein involved in Fe transport
MRHPTGNVGRGGGSAQLRGLSSLTQSGDPLVVIDGVVARGAGLDLLRMIPATDVDEISVLRGPAAAFLYPYAANGVISVTTKKR